METIDDILEFLHYLLLIVYGVCPLSFRTVAANDYRAALLLFYEQNNISAFKRMFLEQVEFANKEYF